MLPLTQAALNTALCFFLGRKGEEQSGSDWTPTRYGVDARQMMTTRVSDTHTHTSSQDTQPAGLPHITSKRTALRHSRPCPPVAPLPSTQRCQGHKKQTIAKNLSLSQITAQQHTSTVEEGPVTTRNRPYPVLKCSSLARSEKKTSVSILDTDTHTPR